jgi:RNA-directed DNA polymerase
MDGRTEQTPPTVPARAQQGGEAAARRARWAWAEPGVWTDRMLAALEQGVQGGVWFRLIDKVWLPRNLDSAWRRVENNGGAAGVDHVSVDAFGARAGANLGKLAEDLWGDPYRPQDIRRAYTPKPGSDQERPLGIPTVRDRVVQGALRHVLEPIFERDFAAHSYGFRPGRGCKDALRRVDELLKRGYSHVVDADLKAYFDTIPHQRLLERVRAKVADGRVLRLVEAFLKAGVMEGLERWTPTQGAPQGAVLSPLLSNIYLDELDHLMAGLGFQMVRYADDFVVLCRSGEEAARALDQVRRWTAQAGLSLHPEKTRVVDGRTDGFDFLGYRFERGTRRPRDKSLGRFKDAVRGKTRRCQGESLGRIIEDVNRTVRGWFGYFKHSRARTFGSLDGWVRMRLRGILRRRQKKQGRGRGSDHQRWPNAFFAAQGLYSMAAAHALACQPARR